MDRCTTEGPPCEVASQDPRPPRPVTTQLMVFAALNIATMRFLFRRGSTPREATQGGPVMSSPLAAAHAVTKLPAQNLDRARRFYRDRLGLEPVEERKGGLRYVCGTAEFHIFASS